MLLCAAALVIVISWCYLTAYTVQAKPSLQEMTALADNAFLALQHQLDMIHQPAAYHLQQQSFASSFGGNSKIHMHCLNLSPKTLQYMACTVPYVAEFMELMEFRFQEKARSHGCFIVSAAGFDSIPADLGVLFTQRQFEAPSVPSSVTSFLSIQSGPAGACGKSLLLHCLYRTPPSLDSLPLKHPSWG